MTGVIEISDSITKKDDTVNKIRCVPTYVLVHTLGTYVGINYGRTVLAGGGGWYVSVWVHTEGQKNLSLSLSPSHTHPEERIQTSREPLIVAASAHH